MKRLSSSSAATATSRGIKLDDDAVKLIASVGRSTPRVATPGRGGRLPGGAADGHPGRGLTE
jgi:hypothetical protein